MCVCVCVAVGLLAISVAVRSGKRPFTASVTLFFPLLFLCLAYLPLDWASVGVSVSALLALARAGT